MFGDDPYPLHVLRLTEIDALPMGWGDADTAPALGHALLTGEFAQVCRRHGAQEFGRSDNRGEAQTYGLISAIPGDSIPRYEPRDEQDATKGGPCGRCGRRCPASALANHGGKRLCRHCRRLRQDPERVGGRA